MISFIKREKQPGIIDGTIISSVYQMAIWMAIKPHFPPWKTFMWLNVKNSVKKWLNAVFKLQNAV